jgi:hypothetical protein
MTAEPEGSGELSEAQRAGLNAHHADQDRTLAAMHQLEAALGSAAPGRAGPWWQAVVTALAVLDAATTDEEVNAGRPDSLLSDIKRTQPRLRTRVRGVRAQYTQLRRALSELRDEFTDAPDLAPDVADIRQRLAWLLTALRHQRARESDLIYEAYFDAFNADLDRDAVNPD